MRQWQRSVGDSAGYYYIRRNIVLGFDDRSGISSDNQLHLPLRVTVGGRDETLYVVTEMAVNITTFADATPALSQGHPHALCGLCSVHLQLFMSAVQSRVA